jgi:hypothetical protein
MIAILDDFGEKMALCFKKFYDHFICTVLLYFEPQMPIFSPFFSP